VLRSALKLIASSIQQKLEQQLCTSSPEGDTTTYLAYLDVPSPQPCSVMVAVHGWLLGYPAVYCYLSSTPSGGASCLSGQVLNVVQLTATEDLGRSQPKVTSSERHTHDHLVCSFSVPTDDNSDSGGHMLSQPWMMRWHQGVKQRFSGQSCWQLKDTAVEMRVQEHVVL